MKWISDRGERCQALCKRRLAIDKTALSLEFVIHLRSLREHREKFAVRLCLEMLRLSEDEEEKII